MKYNREKRHRRHFLNCLNKFRFSGTFTLDEKSFNQLGSLLYICLDEAWKTKDYESIRSCMNISQILYKTAIEPNKPRVFMQSLIEGHMTWKSSEFWEELIKCK
jgi:hypothetical protein